MKKILLSLLSMSTMFSVGVAQETVVAGWSFASSSVKANQGVAANISVAELKNEAARTIEFKNGFADKAAQCVSWENGANTKYWSVEISTAGYNNITLSSKQTSGGTNPGPQDFKLQYKVGSGDYVDVPSAAIVVKNDWTTGVLTKVAIPEAAWNSASVITLRWLVTTNINSNGGAVDATGISKIDDVVVYGTPVPVQYTLSVSHTGSGAVIPADGAHLYNANELVTLTATADQGHKFDKWVVGDTEYTTSTVQVSMTANVSAVASFSPITAVADLSMVFSIYPNPSRGTFNFRNAEGVKSVELYSVIGGFVASKKISGATDQLVVEAPKGCYLLKVVKFDGASEVIKVFIN